MGRQSLVGEFIAFLDADDVWEPTKIEKQLAKFAEDAEIGLVHCGMREFNGESGETVKLHLDGQEGWVADEMLLWERPAVIVSGSAVMVSRKAFDEAGGFDTRLKVGGSGFLLSRGPPVQGQICTGATGELPQPWCGGDRNVREMERGMGLFYEKAFADGADS